MDKRIVICIIVILSLALIVFTASQIFEIYPVTRRIMPSDDVYYDQFFAVKTWLNETGHPFRYETFFYSYDMDIQEKVILLFTGAVFWEYASEVFIPWIESGNSLVVFCDDYYDPIDNDYFFDFIDIFGVKIDKDIFIDDVGRYGIDFPNFELMSSFLVDEKPGVSVIKDKQGQIKFAEVPYGEGKFIITGYPDFMVNYYIDREINASLTWEITAAQTTVENPGVLFIKNERIRIHESMFGKIMKRGNLIPVFVSAFLAVIIGFWIVIPVFGIVREERQSNSRPIRERFSAEIKFLRKYKALNCYVEAYEREFKEEKKPKNEKYNYGEIINKIRSVYDGTNRFKRGSGSFKT